jgi:hypothetical protein
MLACANCYSQIPEASRFCSVCGRPNTSATQIPGNQVSAYPFLRDPSGASKGGFGQLFGLDPRVTFVTLAVDTMLFGGAVVTVGTTALLSVPAGIALGFITYKAQRHWYRDDRESALIKGMIVGLLTAIPTGLPGFLTIPSGVVGLVHLLRRKKADTALVMGRPVRN